MFAELSARPSTDSLRGQLTSCMLRPVKVSEVRFCLRPAADPGLRCKSHPSIPTGGVRLAPIMFSLCRVSGPPKCGYRRVGYAGCRSGVYRKHPAHCRVRSFEEWCVPVSFRIDCAPKTDSSPGTIAVAAMPERLFAQGRFDLQQPLICAAPVLVEMIRSVLRIYQFHIQPARLG